MLKRTLIALSLGSLLVASGAQAITIDLTLDVDLISSPSQVIFTIGLEDASDSSPTAINGYTLDYSFEGSVLSFASASQLVSFGALGTLPFSPADGCADNARCTAGNVVNFDSGAVGDLFSVTFDILSPIGSQLVFSAGVLDSVFDGVTQPTGDSPFTEGDMVVNYVPEPSTFALASMGLIAIAAIRGRRR